MSSKRKHDDDDDADDRDSSYDVHSVSEDEEHHHYDSKHSGTCKKCKEMSDREDSGAASITESNKQYYHGLEPLSKKKKTVTCYGCLHSLANQQARMGPGGCMHTPEDEDEKEEKHRKGGAKKRKTTKKKKITKRKKGKKRVTRRRKN